MKKIFHNRDLMNCSLYPIWFCTASHYHTQESVKGHFMHQILFIVDGKGTLHHDGNTYELSKGCAFFLKENHYAEYIDNGGLVSAFITAKGPAADILIKNLAPEGFLFFENTDYEHFIFLIKQLVDCYDNGNDQAKLSAMTYSIFTEFLSKSKDKTPDKLDAVVSYINKNFNQKLTLKELAENCYISTSKLCHDFKKRYSMTVFDYILELRLENAYTILHSESDIAITEVATRCGFYDSCYFCKAYKKKFGQTPKHKI